MSDVKVKSNYKRQPFDRPMTEEELLEGLARSYDDVRNGRVYPLEEVIEKMDERLRKHGLL